VSKELAVLLTVAAGGLVAAQAPVNNVVSKKVGTLGAVSVNFIVGTVIVLFVTFLFTDGIQNIQGVDTPAWYYWLFGGIAGVAIVLTTLVTVRELGAGGVTAATIAGQLTLSILLDRAGVLGLDERAITVQKMLGVALLAAGTVLVVHE
jgi:bacterial/archaeal transporter family-2 protein